MWRRFATALRRFPAGVYLADLGLAEDSRDLPTTLFRAALGTFVRGGVYLDFDDDTAAIRELLAAGFDSVTLHRPTAFTDLLGPVETASARRVRILDART